jgi:hypothetical protein
MIKNGLIVALVLLSIFLFMAKKQRNTVTTTIDTVTVTKEFTKFTKGDKIPYKILDTIYKQNYDTTYIVKDYQQVKEFTDSIRQDSNLFVIKDTISQNRIIGRSFQAKIQEKTITITNNIQAKPKSALYIGFRSDISQDYTKWNTTLAYHLKLGRKAYLALVMECLVIH